MHVPVYTLSSAGYGQDEAGLQYSKVECREAGSTSAAASFSASSLRFIQPPRPSALVGCSKCSAKAPPSATDGWIYTTPQHTIN